MKHHFFQKEIILVTDAGLRHNNLYAGNTKTNSVKEYKKALVKACMQGVLCKMLQGIVEVNSSAKNIYPWRLNQHADILEIELGVYPLPIEDKFSINTGAFLNTVEYN